MISRIPVWICLFALSLLAAPCLHAQPAAAAASSVPRTFRILSIVGSYEALFYQTTADKVSLQAITVTRSLSQPLPAPKGAKLEIFRWVPPPPDAPPGTPPTRQVALTAMLDLNAPESIVVATPLTPANEQTLFTPKVIALTEDDKARTCLVANLTDFPSAAVSLKETVHTLEPGAVKRVTFEKGHNLLKVAVQIRQNNAWALAGDDAWRLNDLYRGYILILPYMEDPDFPPPLDPPPALVRINFEISPEIRSQKAAAAAAAAAR